MKRIVKSMGIVRHTYLPLTKGAQPNDIKHSTIQHDDPRQKFNS